MLRAFSGIAGVGASQEFSDGALLGLARRIAEISGAFYAAGEPGKCDPVASSTRADIGSGACFPERSRSNRRAVYAGRFRGFSSARPNALGPDRDRRRVGPRFSCDRASVVSTN